MPQLLGVAALVLLAWSRPTFTTGAVPPADCSPAVVRAALSPPQLPIVTWPTAATGQWPLASFARFVVQTPAPFPVLTRQTTPYGGSSPSRAHNVELAANRLNGAVVAPGEVFSLKQRIGPLTRSGGYAVDYGIVVENGEAQTVPSPAGGASQVATTLYQAIFWAGYPIDERTPHAYWIGRYGHEPTGLLGIEATVDEFGADLRFRNDGPGQLTILAEADGQRLSVSLSGEPPAWSIQVIEYRVDNLRGGTSGVWRSREAGVPPGQRIVVAASECGFDVRLVRLVSGPAMPDRTLVATSPYLPARPVVVEGGRAW
ncbi:MAG: VanW family protein [Chloroflexi bacterium]|nr:VanW family protein [Chloroflexota bacterium]